jgi:DNA processing protein
VAGSRQPTVYGRRVTRSLSAELAREDVLIISGLARGVEGLAHQTALDQGGLTLAVLAHGLDLVYPPEHARLLENIKRTGLIVSEHPPGTRPQRQFFPARNRILSGLADVVVITEAARSCGSQITAGFAADQGREVLAVPGPVFSQQSQGCHQLIKDGAGLLESSADIFSCRPLPATRD